MADDAGARFALAMIVMERKGRQLLQFQHDGTAECRALAFEEFRKAMWALDAARADAKAAKNNA